MLPFLHRLLYRSAKNSLTVNGLAEVPNHRDGDSGRARIEDPLKGLEPRSVGLDTHDIDPRNSCEKRGIGEADDGSRFEVRGFLNFEPRTSNFVSPPLRAVLFPMIR